MANQRELSDERGGASASLRSLHPLLAAWRLGPTSGVLWAGTAALIWLVVDRSSAFASASLTAWEGALRLAILAVVALSVAALRRQRDLVHTLAGTDRLGVVVCVGAPQSAKLLVGRAESLMDAAKRSGGALVRTEVLDEHVGIEASLRRS